MRPDAAYCRAVRLELVHVGPRIEPKVTENLSVSSSQPTEPLDSWKEIARYLNPDESTAANIWMLDRWMVEAVA